MTARFPVELKPMHPPRNRRETPRLHTTKTNMKEATTMTSWNPPQRDTDQTQYDLPPRRKPTNAGTPRRGANLPTSARRAHRAERARKAATAIAGTGVAGLVVVMALTDHTAATPNAASATSTLAGATSPAATLDSTVVTSTTSAATTTAPTTAASTTTTTSAGVTEYIDEYGNIVDQYGNIISENTQSTVQSSPNVYTQPQVQTRGSG